MSDMRLSVLLELRDRALAPLMSIAKGNEKLVKGLEKTQEQLQKLSGQKQALDSMAKLQERYKKASDAVSLARAKLIMLQTQMPANDQAQKKHAAAIKKAESALQRATRVQDAYRQNLMKTRTELNRLGIGKLSAAQASLPAQIEKTTAALQRQREALEKLDHARAKHKHDMMRGGAMVAAGLGMTRSASRLLGTDTGAIGQFMAHEDAMLGIARQVPGARDEMGRLTEVYRQAEADVRALSQTLPLSTVEIANMMTAAARMEVPTERLKEQVQLAAEMAIAFDAVPDEIAEAMGKVAKNFDIPVTQIRGLADVINYLDDNAISKGGDIIDYLNRTSGVLSTMAMNDRQAAALGSTLLTLGERAETAATATNAIFQKFAAGEVSSDALKELGLTAERLQSGMSQDAMATFQDVLQRINDLPQEKRMGVMMDMVGLNHSDTLAKLVTKQNELQRQLALASGTQAQGSMAREAAAQFATASAKMQLLKNEWFNLSAIAGEALVPALLSIMKGITPIIRSVSAWMTENPKLTASLLGIAAAAGPLLMIFGGLKMFASIMAVRKALAAAGAASKAAAGGVDAMYRACYALGRTWSKLVPLLRTAGAAIARFSVMAAGKLAMAGRAALVFMASPIGIALALVATAITLWVTRWDAIKEGLQLMWEDLTAACTAGLAWLQSLPQRMWQAGSDMIQGLINGVTAKLGELRGAITGVADQTAGWFRQKLGINSPSRVFMQYGGWVSEGAAMGIAQRAPMVARAAARMAALPALAAMPHLPAMAGPAPAMGAPAATAATAAAPAWQITINAQPGQDAQAIARAVTAEIDRRERQRSARAYSHLGDR